MVVLEVCCERWVLRNGNGSENWEFSGTSCPLCPQKSIHEINGGLRRTIEFCNFSFISPKPLALGFVHLNDFGGFCQLPGFLRRCAACPALAFGTATARNDTSEVGSWSWKKMAVFFSFFRDEVVPC